METLPERILKSLEELGEEQFKKFQWFLREPNPEGLEPPPKSFLEGADRMKTVDLIMQSFPSKEPQILIHVLKKIERNDLVVQFLNTLKGR